jgi:hypothetical protein
VCFRDGGAGESEGVTAVATLSAFGIRDRGILEVWS